MKGENIQLPENAVLKKMLGLAEKHYPLEPEEIAEFNELTKKHIAKFSNSEFEKLLMALISRDRYQLLPAVFQYRSDFTDLVNDSEEFKTNPVDAAAVNVSNFEKGGRTALLLLAFGNQWRGVTRRQDRPFHTGYFESMPEYHPAYQLGVRNWDIYKNEDG